jgi:hypothetical protein
MVQVSRKLGEFLRHKESGLINAQGYAPLGGLTIALQIGASELLDAALFSYHTKNGYRFELSWEEVAKDPPTTEPHNVSFLYYKVSIRAKNKHSIEIMSAGPSKDQGGTAKKEE